MAKPKTLEATAYLDHVELSDAVLLHAHGHGDSILLDQHVCAPVEPTLRVSVSRGKRRGRDAPLTPLCYPSGENESAHRRPPRLRQKNKGVFNGS